MRIEPRKPREFVQLMRGGEKIWAEVLKTFPDGSMKLRCDSLTRGTAPRKDEVFDAPADEVVIDRVVLP